MSTDPLLPAPDDKDWTWVLERPCTQCGFAATAIAPEDITAELLATTPRWQTALRRTDVRVRPNPATWSALEYGCHVRDVHTMFGARARLMLGEDNPEFENWDQDQTALEKRYWTADPGRVAQEIAAAAQATATVFTGLSEEQWSRPGRRSNGSVFTTETLGIYYLHDIVHHLHDVRA
jgi:hypothetical protein